MKINVSSLIAVAALLNVGAATVSAIATDDFQAVKVGNSVQAEASAEFTQKLSNYPLFFVTNRLESENKSGAVKFKSQRSPELVYGEYLRANANDDLKSARMITFKSEKEFLAALKETGKNAAVFVHGYRKSFTGSMQFGLSMAKQLDAPLVVFAWPSKNNYAAYMTDECTAEWSAHPLAQVLGDMGDAIGFRHIAIVSHSLGARMVEWSLKDLYAERRPSEPFAATLFFSPDVDRDTFLQDAKFLKTACSTCRVYLDKHDTRIWISKVLHGSPRVGSNEKGNSNQELAHMFQFDTSLPNHHIPFSLVAASVRRIATGESDSSSHQ